jgi:predicted RNase H-like nuclease
MPAVIGVDGCKDGWIAARAPSDGAPAAEDIRISVYPTIIALLEDTGENAIIAIDMPMGLPERINGSGRGPEQAIRSLLGERQSSVFAIPGRAAVYAVDPQPSGMAALKQGHQKASAVARSLSEPPRGISFQTFNILPKIRELDQLLVSAPSWRERIFEVHPELAFWRMNDERSLATPKKIKGKINSQGIDERRALLMRHGLPLAIISAPPPRGASVDDQLDALACLVAARAIATGEGRPFPEPFTRDAKGIAIAIWSWL